MKKIIVIVSSWLNANKNRYSDLTIKRKAICDECPYMKKSSIILFFEVIFRIQEPQGYKCKKCGCGILAKLSNELMECPIEKW